MNEFICDDCRDGDHEACRREGGFLNDEAHISAEDSDSRCGCHLSGHAFDRRFPQDEGGSRDVKWGW